MKQKTENIAVRIIPGLLFILLCCVSGYVILLCPIPRQIGLTFRNTLYVFPLIFLIAWGFGIVRSRKIRFLLMLLLFSIILLPYSGILNSGASDQYALGGFVPWSDAFTLQLNTQRFLYGGTMGQSTAIRPLSAVFYAVFLHICDNNYLALQFFLCISIALILVFTTDAVNKTLGPICGAVFFTILFFYIRQRLGTFMTEPYGFICGLLCCFFLFTGIYTNNQIPVLLGFLSLSIGLNARPAAMFLFPGIGLWYFFIFLRDNQKRFLWACAALLVLLSGFGLNRITQRIVYGSDKIPNRQAAEMVYGLCLGGKSWGDVVSSSEMQSLNNSENIIKDVVELCAPVIKENPGNIITALKTIFIDSLIKSEYYGAFSYVNGNPRSIQTFLRSGLMIIWSAGFVYLIIHRKEKINSLLLVCAAGIIISECFAVPFSTNYLRLYAVSMWVPACVTGLFPQFISNKVFKNEFRPKSYIPAPDHGIIIPGVYILLLFTCAIIGPGYIRSNPLNRPSEITEYCKADEDVLITSIDVGSFIYMAEKSEIKAEHYPYFRLPYVRQHIHDTASIEMFDFTDAIDNSTAVIRGIDLMNFKDALVFAPLEMVENRTGYAQFCGHFIDPPILRDDRFFIPSTVYFYEDGL